MSEAHWSALGRWNRANASYHEAARELEHAAYPYLGELVRKHFPTAARLVVFGQMNEDYVNVLRAERVVLTDDSVVEEITDGVINEDFEAMAEEAEEVLSWLIDLNPDDWFGEHEIEVAAQAPVGTAPSVVRKLKIAGVEVTVSSVIPRSVAAEVLDLLVKAEELLGEKES